MEMALLEAGKVVVAAGRAAGVVETAQAAEARVAAAEARVAAARAAGVVERAAGVVERAAGSTGAGRLAGATVAVDVVVEGPTEAKAVAMATEEPGKTRHSPT